MSRSSNLFDRALDHPTPMASGPGTGRTFMCAVCARDLPLSKQSLDTAGTEYATCQDCADSMKAHR